MTFPVTDSASSDSVLQALDQFISTLSQLATGFSVGVIEEPQDVSTVADRSQNAISMLMGLDPGEPDIGVSFPAWNPKATPEINYVPANIEIPQWSGRTVDIDTSGKPGALTVEPPANAPEFSTPVLPESPVVSTPVMDSMYTLNFPAPPATTSITPYDGVLPADDLLPPTANWTYAETAYESALATLIETKLLDALNNTDSTDEKLLIGRARDRAFKSFRQKVDGARRFGASSGFPLPQPFMQRLEEEAYTEAGQAVADANREIYLKKTEDRKFITEKAIEYEHLKREFHNAFWERQLNAAKAVADLGVALFNMSVSAFNAKVARYQAGWDGYKKMADSLLVEVEIYKAMIQAELGKSEVNKSIVEKYIAELRAVETQYNLYLTKMKGVEMEVSIQKMELEKYGLKVTSFAELVKAHALEWQGYEAQIKGETAKVQALEAEARVFESRVKAAEAQARVEEINANIAIANGKIQLEALIYDLRAYEAQIKSAEASDDALTRIYLAKIERIKALGSGILTAMQSAAESEKTNVMAKAEIAKAKVGAADANVKNALTVNDLRIRAASAGAETLKAYIIGIASQLTNLAGQIDQNITYAGSIGSGASA
ncbi:MAG: hypothetical protein HQK86_00145 [Nitrospinae bacterium]|nr:hypothetical protein [Nitrospinota bacterium]